MTISTDSILQVLKDGTYTLDTLLPSRFFKTKIPDKRKRFPSVELLETPTGNTTDQEETSFVRKFNVSIFLGLRGGTTTGQTNEISTLETLEEEILAVLENTPILEHKLIINERTWNRDYNNNKLRPFIISTLSITARQITGTTSEADGVLIFDTFTSTIDDEPGGNYEYSDVFNTDISSGYRDTDEFTTRTHNPFRYTGGFEGSFITHIRVSAEDIGITGEKLNNLQLLRTTGEKGIVGFTYKDKFDDTPGTVTMENALKITIDDIREIYRSKENTVFRITGKLLEPKTISIL